MRLSAIALLLLTVLSAPAANQQGSATDPQQPTFRTGTESVRVDLYVTRNGEPVSDLRREEVHLFEDDRPQTMQTFERIAYAGHSAALPPEPRSLEETRRLAADPRSRLFVLFIPTADAGYALGPTAESRRLLVEPLNNLLGPDDLIAVMTPYLRLRDLTFLRRVLINDTVMLSFADEADPKHRLWDSCYSPIRPGSPNAEMKARHLESITFEALEALVTQLASVRDERKHVLLVTDGFRLFTENPDLRARGGLPDPQAFPTGRGPTGLGTQPRLGDATAMTDDMFRECQKDLDALASLNHRTRLDELAERARRNNVSFTPVSLARMQTQNASGRVTTRATAEATTPREMESLLRGLAERTGGTAIVGTNDIEGSLRGMMAVTSAYYLLGYTPTNTALDGKFRRITVKVDRPGVVVHARPGYTAGTPAETRAISRPDTAAPTAMDTALAVLASANTSRQVRVSTASWTRKDARGQPAGALWIAGEVDAAARPASAPPSTRSVQVTVQPEGTGRGVTKRSEIAAGAAAFAIDVTEDPLPPGQYSVRVTITRPDGEAVSEITQVALPAMPTSLGEPVMYRRGPATAQRYVRTAIARFERNERLRLEVPTDVTGGSTAVLRDSKGAILQVPVTVTERMDDSGAWGWITADVTLAPLAAAVYAVEITQGSLSRVTAFRVVP